MVAVQEALLDWVHDDEYGDQPRQPDPDDFVGDIRAHYYDGPLTQAEVLSAAAALYQLDQISGATVAERPAPLRVRVTAKGLETVQRGGKLYAVSSGPSVTYTNVFQERVGAVAQGSHIEQVMNVGLDANALAMAFRSVQEAIGQLPDDEQQEATHQLIVIQAEAEGGFDDASTVQRKYARLQAIGEKATSTVFTSALAQLGVALGRLRTGG